MQVHVSSLLQSQLTALQVSQLIEEFKTHRQNGEADSYLLSRDVPNIGSKYLRHIHMRPAGGEALAQWDFKFQRGRAGRTSDVFLFYVDGGRAHGCLLIYIVFDPPGGHPFLKSKAPSDIRLVQQLESIAENFSVWGKIA